ncbi:MAG: tetratricopeptide repeat protein [Alphaproteobacteria bacterium]|nr:tetratricopeptide repeat protein [Alphaproteobacteria bacterium]
MTSLPAHVLDPIRADPDGEAAWGVLSDWLQQADDPRGELVAVDRELERTPWAARGRALRDRRRELLDRHRELEPPADGVRLQVSWFRGYWRTATVDLDPDDDAPLAGLRALLAHPCAALLRELEIDLGGRVHLLNNVDAVLAERDWPVLHALTVRSRPPWPVFSPLDEARARMPALRRLSLVGEYTDSFVDDLDPGGVTHLSLTGSVGPDAVEVAARHPGIRALSLDLFEHPDGADAALAVQRLPPLDHLGLRGLQGVAAFVAHASCEVRDLDLSMGDLDDEAAAVLARRSDALRVERLDVRDCRLTEAGIDALRQAFPEVLADHQEPGAAAGRFAVRVRAQTLRGLRGSAMTHHAAYRRAEARTAWASVARLAEVAADREEEIRAWEALGGLASDLGDLDGAERLQRRVLAWRPSDRGALQSLALTRRTQGRTHEAEELLERAVALAPERTELAAELATLQMVLGRLSAASDTIDAARQREREARRERARTFSIAGMIRQQQGRLEEAEDAYREALQREMDPAGALPIRLNIGQVRWLLGRVDAARDTYEGVATSARELGIPQFEAAALADLGHLHLNGGRMQEAIAALEAAEPLLVRRGDLPKLGNVRINLGAARLSNGDLDGAEQALRAGIDAMQRSGNRQWAAIGKSSLANVHLERGDREAGEALCREVLAEQVALGDRWSAASTRTQLADLHLARGEPAQARALLEAAAADAVAARNTRWAAWVRAEQARVVHLEHPEGAVDAYRAALAGLEPIGDDALTGRALLYLGVCEPTALEAARQRLEAAADRGGLDQVATVEAYHAGRDVGAGTFADWLRQLPS